jgi:hypothetical protein
VIYSVVYFMPVNSLFVFVIYCAFIRSYSFVYFVRCSIILFSFSLSFVVLFMFKRENNNSDPELCSGISIPSNP